jgi:hypothetical protein
MDNKKIKNNNKDNNNENDNNFFQDGLDSEISKYIEFISNNENEAIYRIIQNEDSNNSKKIMDDGLLISLIDSYSSFSNFFISKINKENNSLSISIKLTSFGLIKDDKEYIMKVKINHEDKKFIQYEVNIFDKENNLIKNATHLKKFVKAKF